MQQTNNPAKKETTINGPQNNPTKRNTIILQADL